MGASSFPVGGMTSAAWREEAIARVEALKFLKQWIVEHCDGAGNYDDLIDKHLDVAERAAFGVHSRWWIVRVWRRLENSQFERALANIDMAENDLLRLARDPVLEGALPSIEAHVNRYLAKDDPRRVGLIELIHDHLAEHDDGRHAAPEPPGPPGNGPRNRRWNGVLTNHDRERVLNALFAANTQRRRNLARVRSFRNMIAGGILAASIIAIAIGMIGLLWPAAMPVCFTPEAEGRVMVACPQTTADVGELPLSPDVDMDDEIADGVRPGDLLLIEFLGLVGAALSVTALLRGLKGTSTPYNVPLFLAILKVPTGAITAVVGLLLMRADFVPGLSALDTPSQILGWALIFGIAQQLVTRIADNRAHALLDEVGGRGPAGDRPLASRPAT